MPDPTPVPRLSPDRVLLTSAGRRVSLLEGFRAAVAARGPGAGVLAADARPDTSPACQRADRAFPVPRVSDPGYAEAVAAICAREGVTLVVPTIDPELEVLAAERARFDALGVDLAVSSVEVCATFASKRRTDAYFAAHGLPAPRRVDDPATARYPLFAKRDRSSASVGAGLVHDPAEARALLARHPDYFFQEVVTGDEYTVDVFVARGGAVLRVVPRRRLEVRAGEVSKGVTVRHRAVIDAVRGLCEGLPGAYGTLTVQVMHTPEGLRFIEVNPRFGGGYPLTREAGADFAGLLLDQRRGIVHAYAEDWEDGVLMLRYDAEVFCRGRHVRP